MYDSLDKIGLKAVLEAIKDKIPASLPANGGNADTLGGLHADDFAKSTSPRINGDMVFLSDTNQNTISAIYSANDCLVFRNYIKDWSSICDVVIDNNGVRIANSTQNFKVGDGGNADTVDGLHASDFYSIGNKPYVTGSVTVAANSTTAITNHGFIPSAALYLGIGNEVRFAPSFTTTSINLTDVQMTERTINYIIFK